MKITEIKDKHGEPPNTQSNRNNENPPIDNQHFEERMFSALDAVCRSSSQSYDEFMSGFTYLKPEHVKQQGPSTSSEDFGPPPEFLEFQKKFLSNHSQSRASMSSVHNTNNCDDNENLEMEVASIINKPDVHEPEVLEEQVLEEGTRTQTFLMRPDTLTKNTKVKVGNFIDENEASEDDESDCNAENNYLPSFIQEEKPSNEDSERTQNQCTSTEKSEENNIINPSSLPNVNQESHLPKQPGDNYKQAEQDVREHLIGQELLKRNIKIQNEEDQSENLLDLIDSCEVESESSEELEYDPSLDRLNFGEIEDEETDAINETKEVNQTHLEFRVICDKPKESQDETVQKHGSDMLEENVKLVEHITDTNEAVSDEVEAFQLDDGFDYDNVKLTPKFNAEEMAIIMNITRLGPIYPQPLDEDENEE